MRPERLGGGAWTTAWLLPGCLPACLPASRIRLHTCTDSTCSLIYRYFYTTYILNTRLTCANVIKKMNAHCLQAGLFIMIYRSCIYPRGRSQKPRPVRRTHPCQCQWPRGRLRQASGPRRTVRPPYTKVLDPNSRVTCVPSTLQPSRNPSIDWRCHFVPGSLLAASAVSAQRARPVGGRTETRPPRERRRRHARVAA